LILKTAVEHVENAVCAEEMGFVPKASCTVRVSMKHALRFAMDDKYFIINHILALPQIPSATNCRKQDNDKSFIFNKINRISSIPAGANWRN
jgi:hypothetical protein